MRFEITINGEKVCTAGIGEYGVLSAIACWRKGNPNRNGVNFSECVSFGFGGLDCNGPSDESDFHVRWLDREMNVGDEILIRILDPGSSDQPKETFARCCTLGTDAKCSEQ